MAKMAEQFKALYIIPKHYDLLYGKADPAELQNHLAVKILEGTKETTQM
jgi:hypothetical protein